MPINMHWTFIEYVLDLSIELQSLVPSIPTSTVTTTFFPYHGFSLSLVLFVVLSD